MKSTEALAIEVDQYAKGKVPRELRHAHISALALDLFIERGFAAASMDELARRAQVSKPVIYDLVGSKDALFEQVMTEVGQRMSDHVTHAVVCEPDSSRRLYAGILAFLVFVHNNRGAWRALLTAESGLANRLLDTLRKRQAALVAGLVIASAPSPISPMSAELLAYAINGSAEAGALWWRAHPDVPAPTLARVLTESFSTDWTTLGPALQDLPAGANDG